MRVVMSDTSFKPEFKITKKVILDVIGYIQEPGNIINEVTRYEHLIDIKGEKYIHIDGIWDIDDDTGLHLTSTIKYSDFKKIYMKMKLNII